MLNRNYPAILIILSILTAGCSGIKIKKDGADHFLEKWKLLAENAKGHSPSGIIFSPKPLLEESERPEPVKKEDIKKYEHDLPTKPVTIKMRKADIILVLRILARAAGVNMIVNEKITGDVSIHFVNTPWDQAFISVLDSVKLTYRKNRDIIEIITKEDLEEEINKRTNLLAKKKKMRSLEPMLQPRVVPITFGDAKKIQENLSKILLSLTDGNDKHGSVIVDEHTNSLIIQATKSNMNKLLKLIENLDKPAYQILIEAHIIETSRDTARNLGIKWGSRLTGNSDGNKIFVTPGTAKVSGTESDRGFGVNFPAKTFNFIDPATLGLAFGKIDGDLLEMQLSALEGKGEIKILSRPSITTLDNQVAYTENGTKIPYVSTTTQNGQVTQTVKFIDAVMRLEIVPHVIDGKNIKIKIDIRKDEVDESRQVLGNPFIIKKQTSTNMIVEDGETIVISGFTKESKTNSSSGVPWLKDIPLIGWLFRSLNTGQNEEEVIIFITPNILKRRIKTG